MGAASYLYHHKWGAPGAPALADDDWCGPAGVLVRAAWAALPVSPGIAAGLFIMLALLGQRGGEDGGGGRGRKIRVGRIGVFLFADYRGGGGKYKDLFIASGWQLLVCILSAPCW